MLSHCIVTDAVLLWHQSTDDVFITQTHTHVLESSTLNHNSLRHEMTHSVTELLLCKRINTYAYGVPTVTTRMLSLNILNRYISTGGKKSCAALHALEAKHSV